jgi:tetratricopeptide (TPR) repeat protein
MVSAFKTAWEAAGIPMQGTALTLPAASEKPVNKEDKTKIPEEAKTAIGKETRKKRSPWLFISAAIILTISCVFVFLALRGIRNRRLAAQEQESVSSQVLDVPPELEPARPGPEQPLAEFDEPPLEVQEAQRIADENPEDPVAQLELALAFWDAGMQRPAYESLNHAADMAAENVDFLIEAGDQFHMRQAWIASAAMYLRAQKRIGDRRDVPEEVIMNFHEAVYMAAPNPELESTFPLIDEIMRIDQPIGLVAQARHAFHNGKIDEAHELLNQVNRLVPDMFEAKLLEAEMAVIEERFEAANLLLQPLMADTGAPEWIRVMAEDLHNRIP